MPLAVHESIVPGRSPQEQLEALQALRIAGIEVSATGLSARVPEIATASQQTGVRVAAVCLGPQHDFIAPDLDEREAAINALRQACADAVDLGAAHVVLVPHTGPSRMPDLRPYQSAAELESQMMIRLLRTVSDLAYALGIELDYMPTTRQHSSFLHTLAQAVWFREKINASQYIKIAVNLRHMSFEESDLLGSLQANLAHIGYIQLAEQNHRLPGAGETDFAALAEVLQDYEGWLSLSLAASCDWAALPASLLYLREMGLAL